MRVQGILGSSRLWLCAGFVLLASFLLLSHWQPSDKVEHSICFFRQVTGVPCPGCGLTRGFAALSKLDFSHAIEKHPLSPLFGSEAILFWICWGLIATSKIPMPSSAVINRFLVLQMGLLLLTWCYRVSERIPPA